MPAASPRLFLRKSLGSLLTPPLSAAARPAIRAHTRRRHASLEHAGTIAPLPLPESPVLLVYPHVDDETIAAGGLLAARRLAGADLVYTTDSSAGGLGATAEDRRTVRRAEAEQLARRTGLASVRILSGVNDHLATQIDDVAQELAEIVSEGCYRTILTTGPFDAHHDHVASARVVSRALSLAEYQGAVWVGENSNALPLDLVTHAHPLDRGVLAARAALFRIFASQPTMGFELFDDLARGRAALHPGAEGVELFHLTNAAGFARLVALADEIGFDELQPHRLGNPLSAPRTWRGDRAVDAAVRVKLQEVRP